MGRGEEAIYRARSEANSRGSDACFRLRDVRALHNVHVTDIYIYAIRLRRVGCPDRSISILEKSVFPPSSSLLSPASANPAIEILLEIRSTDRQGRIIAKKKGSFPLLEPHPNPPAPLSKEIDTLTRTPSHGTIRFVLRMNA